MPTDQVSSRWWVSPLIFSGVLLALLIIVWRISETAREVLAKAVAMMIGALATPFILEASVAITGLIVVITYNQWRLKKEGDGWVYLAKTEPEEGKDTPPHRLDAVVLHEKPAVDADLEARLMAIEGYLELGLKAEALAALNELPAEERARERVQRLLHAAEGV